MEHIAMQEQDYNKAFSVLGLWMVSSAGEKALKQ